MLYVLKFTCDCLHSCRAIWNQTICFKCMSCNCISTRGEVNHWNLDSIFAFVVLFVSVLIIICWRYSSDTNTNRRNQCSHEASIDQSGHSNKRDILYCTVQPNVSIQERSAACGSVMPENIRRAFRRFLWIMLFFFFFSNLWFELKSLLNCW